jgi:hypothetical protein
MPQPSYSHVQLHVATAHIDLLLPLAARHLHPLHSGGNAERVAGAVYGRKGHPRGITKGCPGPDPVAQGI